MMSGPDPGALPMMNRIGRSGNTGCAACAADIANRAGRAIADNSFRVRIWILLP
jgi:hypothetical protein